MTATAQAEVERLARFLFVEPEQLADVKGLPADDLAGLHSAIDQWVYADAEPKLARVAGLVGVIPTKAVAALAEKFLPPMLAARVAAHLSAAKAKDLVTRLSPGYQVELAEHMDAARCSHVLAETPPAVVADLAESLAERGSWATLAQIAPTVSEAAAEATIPRLTAEQWAEVAAFLETASGDANPNVDRILAAAG